MTEKFQFLMPMQIYFGENIIQKIGEKTRAFGSRALIVAGAMAKNSGALQKVIHPLEKAGIEYVLFDKVEAQPRVPTIIEAAQLAREKKCEVVIGIGGECPMDAAKVMAALAQDTVPISNYFGEDKIRNHPLPIITVPLTAGSGSEVTPFSAITTENDYLEIQTVVSSSIYPTLAFVDPQFTLAFPSAVTIANGVDALSHSIEGIISKKSQPLTDLLALESIRLVTMYLPKALQEPQNLGYRSKLSYAALLGGMVIGQTGMGLVHHMGYHLTLDLGLKHGTANGLLLPWVCEAALGRDRYKLPTIAKGLDATISESTDEETFEKVVEYIQRFISQIGLADEIKNKDLSHEKIKNYSERTLKHVESSLIGSWLVSKEEIEEIYRKALF